MELVLFKNRLGFIIFLMYAPSNNIVSICPDNNWWNDLWCDTMRKSSSPRFDNEHNHNRKRELLIHTRTNEYFKTIFENKCRYTYAQTNFVRATWFTMPILAAHMANAFFDWCLTLTLYVTKLLTIPTPDMAVGVCVRESVTFVYVPRLIVVFSNISNNNLKWW
jgi:hypothetical protein